MSDKEVILVDLVYFPNNVGLKYAKTFLFFKSNLN